MEQIEIFKEISSSVYLTKEEGKERVDIIPHPYAS